MPGGRRSHAAATLEEQLLSYSENAENEGVEEEYLEEEVLQVHTENTLHFLFLETRYTNISVNTRLISLLTTFLTQQVDMATLAEQIIEATPERIKQEDFARGAESPLRERRDNPSIPDPWLATYLDTVDAHSNSPPR